MSNCLAEMCPMWDGYSYPCQTFDIDPENLPANGVFSIEWDEETKTTSQEGM